MLTNLKELVNWVMINPVNFQLSINVEVTMWLPSISWTDFGDPVHDFVVLCWFLEIKLVAGESKDVELSTIFEIFLDQGIKVNILLSISAESSYIDNQQYLALVLRKISELSLQSFHLEIIDGLIGKFAF